MNLSKQAKLTIGIVLMIIYFLVVGIVNFILMGIAGGIGANLVSVGIPASGAIAIFNKKLKKKGMIVFCVLAPILAMAPFNTLLGYENIFAALLLGGLVSIFYIVGVKMIYNVVNDDGIEKQESNWFIDKYN